NDWICRIAGLGRADIPAVFQNKALCPFASSCHAEAQDGDHPSEVTLPALFFGRCMASVGIGCRWQLVASGCAVARLSHVQRISSIQRSLTDAIPSSTINHKTIRPAFLTDRQRICDSLFRGQTSKERLLRQ